MGQNSCTHSRYDFFLFGLAVATHSLALTLAPALLIAILRRRPTPTAGRR